MDFYKSSGFVLDQIKVLGQKVNFTKSSGMKSGLSSKKIYLYGEAYNGGKQGDHAYDCDPRMYHGFFTG